MIKLVRFFLFVLVWMGVGASEPDALYLTWAGDPTTTMTVVWLGGDSSRVLYHPVGGSSWLAVSAEPHLIPETTIQVYMAQIEGLKSDTTYVFKTEGSRREFKFRTLPATLSREVRFVIGGDVFYYWNSEVLDRMNRAVSYDDPDFVILGGDLAYTTGTKRWGRKRQWEADRWQEFFRVMQKSMMGKDGRMIPMIPVVGNHDVHRMNGAKQVPDVFYGVFPFLADGKAYRSLKAGAYLHCVLLDTGHSSPIEGVQMDWLQTTLAGDQTPYLFTVYHVGAYPSVYKYRGGTPALLRNTWVPLFEEARISGAFEHHSHALKRTHPIKDGKVDPTGVIYYGDGSWGVPPRHVHTPAELWYLAMAQSVNACWFIHLSKKGASIEARTPAGEVKDRQMIAPRGAE